MMKKLLFAGLLFSSTAMAQTMEHPWAVGLHGGRIEYNGDLGQGFYQLDRPFYGFGGLSLSRLLTNHLDLVFTGSQGSIGFNEENTNIFKTNVLQYNVSFRLNMRHRDKKLNPYLHAGFGGLRWAEATNGLGDENGSLIPFGIGINYGLGKRFALQLQETFSYTTADNRDKEKHDYNDGLVWHTIGLTYNFGGIKDTDLDGVSDKRDKCPNTPEGIKVDNEGCPLDRDMDGIADYQDACPDVKGVASAKGCPDKDGDTVVDDKDNCPDEAGLTALDGCPDKDGDGIIDSKDKCPNIAGLAGLNGCPDKDGDGITDTEDNCPDVKGPKNLNGCPDGDGDGVLDKEDKCPTVKGTMANKGCPEVKEEVKKIFAKALRGIQFETGKDVIKKVSFPILEEVVMAMRDNPDYKLSIEGHTDDVGDDTKNMDLSNRRANAVMKYLTDKGIAGNRMRAAGFGETVPVADNKTATGRAQNRRVEFKVEF
jgi:OmpA-OmpF porin, OOP family